MENASKALLIAAAVLIVILLIAFGMRIFNANDDTGDQADQTAQSTSMQTFNARLTQYEGKNKTGRTVRDMVTTVNQLNESNPQHTITISSTNTIISGSNSNYKFLGSNNNRYTVSLTYDNKTGYITTVEIKSSTSGTSGSSGTGSNP